MTPEEHADDICWWTSQSLRDRVVAKIRVAVAEERARVLAIVAGGDRPWREIAAAIREIEP